METRSVSLRAGSTCIFILNQIGELYAQNGKPKISRVINAVHHRKEQKPI